MKMDRTFYQPVLEVTRGGIVESIHGGAAAIVDVSGQLLAWYGDPGVVTFLRSSAKPFQALPFMEHGGAEHYQLTSPEIALICSSHSGTDEHVKVVQGIQAKTRVSEGDLMCGTHDPIHEPTSRMLIERHEQPTPNRHNCSGKHTGMLAYIRMNAGMQAGQLPYIDFSHPLQKEILQSFAEMCDLTIDQVIVGIDGCSAPNFAVPLRNAALAYARLAAAVETGTAAAPRVAACRLIASSMIENPEMVGGPGRFDTALMQTCPGKVVSKGGAEGYHGVGILPGVLGPGSPALGIAVKIMDGDARGTACSAFTLAVLRELGALSGKEQEALAGFGPSLQLYNFRKLHVGEVRPCFSLSRS